MSFETRSQFLRWVIPCCSLLLILCCAAMVARPEPERDNAFADALLRPVTTPETVEADLQKKAEVVLAGFGEDAPLAVVTVSMTSDWEDVEAYLPHRDTRTLESIQTKGESFRGASDYMNTRSSENYAVGYTKTTTHKAGPRLQRMSCLAQVSPQNAARRAEIEQAIFVALGGDSGRGDRVMVSVQ